MLFSPQKVFIFLSIVFFLIPAEAKDSSVDQLIFAPHPDDETLCCGNTIVEAINNKEKVKIVFLTNGDAAYIEDNFKKPFNNEAVLTDETDNLEQEAMSVISSEEELANFLKRKITLKPKNKQTPKNPSKNLSFPQKYIALGLARQNEAVSADKILGLKKQDLLFLSYPDRGLSALLDEVSGNHHISDTTGLGASSYRNTYNRAKNGYNKENLLLDIEDILNKYKPKKIFIPFPLDNHSDHRAAYKFLYLALDELSDKDRPQWIKELNIFYYNIHKPRDYIFYPRSSVKTEGSSKNLLKQKALDEYATQIKPLQEEGLYDFFKNSKEEFWGWDNSLEYLQDVRKEWFEIGKIMHEKGYQLNFGVVADIAENIRDSTNRMVKRERIYSDNPFVVKDLVLAAAEGMNDAGVIPVIKHFPGLGRAQKDPHFRLPIISATKEEFYKKELIPYQALLKQNMHFWVMLDHALYPDLDDKPASISGKIATNFLRNELGFNGITIADELNAMQSLREYVAKQGKEFLLEEVVLDTFKAGIDFALIYIEPSKADEAIAKIVERVKKALENNELEAKEFNASIERIIKEKERVFKRPFSPYIKDMTQEEKIAQKLIFDANSDEEMAVFRKYGLGGIDPRMVSFKEKFSDVKIPPFIIFQHEGGKIKEEGVYSKSPSVIGRELELIMAKDGSLLNPEKREKIPQFEKKESPGSSNKLTIEDRNQCLFILKNGIDKVIKNNYYSTSPFMIDENETLQLRSFKELPFEWIKLFPDEESNLFSYEMLKEGWKKMKAEISSKTSFSEKLNLLKDKLSIFNANCRLLCLAAHPDDEDAAALLYFKNNYGCDTSIIFATRGEGGENKIGSQQGKELGFVRSEEAELSSVVLGVDQVYYLGENDFGYTTSLNKVLENWDKDEDLARLNYFYNLIKPDIIITKHADTDEHAQHRVLLILAKNALKKMNSRQPVKFYERTTEKNADLIIEEDCVKIKEALSEHRSQGFELACDSDKEQVYYKLMVFPGKITDSSESKSRSSDNLSGVMGIKVFPRRVGLFEAGENTLFVILHTLGYQVKRVTIEDIKSGKLSDFDTIILGQRAYGRIPGLSGFNTKLFEFMRTGGNLIFFAHDIGEGREITFPYYLASSFNYIPDKNAKVKLLLPGHPLFTFPNKIYVVDFKGWFKQRGASFPEKYSGQYSELTSCFSSDGKQANGGYLVADYGKGSYIFTSYDWYSQFREFHFGALKNLANMVSYKNQKQFEYN